MQKLIFAFLAVTLLLSASCTKKNAAKTTCTSTIRGYRFMYDSSTEFAYGTINSSTSTMAPIVTLSSWWYGLYDEHGAYSISDNSYYTFNHKMMIPGDNDTLIKVNSAGTITILTKVAGDLSGYYNVLYNQFNHKLYCFKDNQLAELTISGSNYSGTTVLPETIYNFSTQTFDNTTGDMYFAIKSDTITWQIRKYHPGASSSTSIGTISNCWHLSGLRYNKNDSMLYAIADTYPVYGGDRFIKINPVTGIVNALSTLSFYINPEFYSAEIDPCSNRYIVSSVNNGIRDTGYINQLDMSGTLVQHDNTVRVVLGLTIN